MEQKYKPRLGMTNSKKTVIKHFLEGQANWGILIFNNPRLISSKEDNWFWRGDGFEGEAKITEKVFVPTNQVVVFINQYNEVFSIEQIKQVESEMKEEDKDREITLFFKNADPAFIEAVYEIRATSYYEQELNDAIECGEPQEKIVYLRERLEKAKKYT